MADEVESKKKQVKSGKKKATHSFKTYIHKVLKSIHPECQISSNSIEQLDEFIKIIARKIVESSRNACFIAKKSTIGEAEIVLSTKLYIPDSLGNLACNEISSACGKFRLSNEKEDVEVKEIGERSKPVRRETQAGIQFSVALCEKFIREFGVFDLNVTKTASVALAAVLEYITREILESAGSIVIDNKKKTVAIRHVFLAINKDPCLLKLTNELNINFLGGGVVPNIRSELLPSKEKRQEQAARRRKNSKNKAKDEDSKKQHKFLPGTKALMEIKKYQKSTNLLLQRLPFCRSVRKIAEKINEEDPNLNLKGIHFGSGTLTVIQTFVESKVVDLCRESVDFAIHAKRDGITNKDIILSWEKTQSFVPYQETAIEEVGDNGLDRLAFRAGVKRKGSGMHLEVRKFIYSLVDMILRKSLYCVKYRKVITICLKDLRESFSSIGVNVTIPNTLGKPKIKKNQLKEENKELQE